MAKEANAELETFRKQWQEEVSARAKASSSNNKSATLSDSPDQESDKKASYPPRVHSNLRERTKNEERADGPEPAAYYDIDERDTRQPLGEGTEGIRHDREAKGEPSSALEHYEQAVERESQGSLGDSLKLYRKAYRVRFL